MCNKATVAYVFYCWQCERWIYSVYTTRNSGLSNVHVNECIVQWRMIHYITQPHQCLFTRTWTRCCCSCVSGRFPYTRTSGLSPAPGTAKVAANCCSAWWFAYQSIARSSYSVRCPGPLSLQPTSTDATERSWLSAVKSTVYTNGSRHQERLGRRPLADLFCRTN